MKSFRPDRESFRPRIENKVFFLLDLGFSLIDHIDPEKRSCQTKPDDQSFADRLIATYTHAQYVKLTTRGFAALLFCSHDEAYVYTNTRHLYSVTDMFACFSFLLRF